MEHVVKPLRDVKVTGSKPTGTKNPTMLRVGVAKNPTMLRVGVAQECDPRVILTA
jgi:hypothetical protein